MTMKEIDPQEFWEFGYLQEVNRRFFHPLGLAMFINMDEETGKVTWGGVRDAREDPEGWYFPDGVDGNKAVAVRSEEISREEKRNALFGDEVIIQPINWVDPNYVKPENPTDD